MKRTEKCRSFQLIVIFRAQRVWDKAEVTNMMGNEITPCVGRFLVEVPGQIETRLSGELIRGVEADTRFMTGYSAKSETCRFTDDLSQSCRMPNVETGTNRHQAGNPIDSSFHRGTGLAPRDDISSLIRPRKAGAKPGGTESMQVLVSDQAYLQSDNTVCGPNEVMFDISRRDDRAAFKRQFILSSRRNPIAKPVSTLP